MSTNPAHARPSSGRVAVGRLALGLVVLAILLSACSPATTAAPRATITFLVRNDTGTNATYRFDGSATVALVSGRLDCMAQTTVGTTWDPTWSFSINDQRAIGSTDSTDLQPGASSSQGLTVIIVVDLSGVRTTAHAGPPLAGEADTPAPTLTPAPSCAALPTPRPS